MRLPGPLTGDQEHQLETVRSSARHLLSLINDLLDLAKIESGKIELRTEPVACQHVVHDVITTLGPLASTRGLSLEQRMPSEDVMARTDRRALNQILLNLTNNAIKFTEVGFVRIELDKPGDDQDTIEIRVRDSGPGIKPDDQEKLFKAFAQIADSSARHGGTGLGLHLSQKLAELLGGSLTFTSEFGRGTSFTLSLPRS
jgi:protein-histidine pros-kinase